MNQTREETVLIQRISLTHNTNYLEKYQLN